MNKATLVMHASLKSALWIFAAALLGGCSLFGNRSLPPLPASDVVTVKQEYGSALPTTKLTDPTTVGRLLAFVNALPPRWDVPWYGPPVGKVYFDFYQDGKKVGNFHVGPNFFGRDGGNFWSESASKKQMDELSAIVGFDVWAYIHEKKPSA